MSIIYLIGGLIAIIFSANSLVGGASALAKRFNISDLVIGLTIVSIGTSTPELAISVISVLKGNTDIAVGNILGSNTSNILLILGISSIIFPLVVNNNTQYKEIPLGILAVALVFFLGNDIILDKGAINVLSRIDGIVLLCFFIIFMYYTFHIATKNDAAEVQIKHQALWKSIGLIIIGAAGLYLGGKYFVEGAVIIARHFGMSDALIGLTIVAIGTSLPELATSIVAAVKKNADIAVGNVIGSNILNIFLVLGISATIRPLPMHQTANFDITVTLLASLLLFLSTFVLNKKIISRSEGVIFVIIYISYISYVIINQ